MDPDEALRLIRAALVDFDRAPDNHMRAVAGALLAEYVEALDGWLSRGGFLPAAWGRPREANS